MGLLRLPTPGFDLQPQVTITQFVIPAGAGATFAASGGIATITTNAAHGLTLNPSAGVAPNYFVTFGGTTSGLTGTGILVGNIFRILSIPSTTTFTIYTTITAATVTSMTVIPVFYAPFTASPGSLYSAPQPSQTVGGVITNYPPPNLEGAYVMMRLGANCAGRVNPAQDAQILDQYTTPSTGTPATAPTWVDQAAASTNDNFVMMPPWAAIWANGTTATTTLSVMN
jgi:hypothetical protein